MDTANGPPTVPSRTILGHPPGLYVLFLTQMWERFSFFGMLALLIIYLNQFLKLKQEDASLIFMLYTTAIYFTPLAGGFLADRLLGNKQAVILGAILMAIGHFLMAFSALTILIAALGFLVVGCGLLTPPLTTQVGLLYAPNDPRRDSAYTIFYMGINLGAFASPLICGWLAENTQGRFHSGFTIAGVGMVIALVTYLLGLPWVIEQDQQEASNADAAETGSSANANGVAPDQRIESVPSAWPWLNPLAPRLLGGLGVLLVLAGILLVIPELIEWPSAVGLVLAGISFLMFAWVAAEVQGGLRDRVLAILILGVFCVCYWSGAGQYGNAINLWADQNTDRHLTQPASLPPLFPAAAEPAASTEEEGSPGFWDRWLHLFRLLPKQQTEPEKTGSEWWSGLWNPVPTAWFQSINPLLILLLAPLFAMLWPWLDRRGLQPSIPVKMALGLLLVTLAFAVMAAASGQEAQGARVAFSSADLPAPLVVNDLGQVCKKQEDGERMPYDAGRLYFDRSSSSLRAQGVFPDLVRDEVVRDTAPADFVAKLEDLQEQSKAASEGRAGWAVQVQLDQEPGDFDLRYAGFGTKTGNQDVRYEPASRTLITTIVLEDKEVQGLKVAAGDPSLRAALNQLMVDAHSSRVSPWWLLGFFFLATLGEMCLSPVGLSMVSQLAPVRFAAMLMGMWLLTFAFGNYLAGFFGKQWGTWTPMMYFLIVTAFLGGATLVMILIIRKVAALMHEGQ